MTRVEVGAAADIEAGERRVVDVNGMEVGVFNVDGEYHALLNTCPHQRGPVCEGEIVRSVEGRFEGPGHQVEEVYGDDLAIVCPWHAWSFDITTGEHLGDRDIFVPTYDVVVEDGRVFVEA